jgi:antitoxin VapB
VEAAMSKAESRIFKSGNSEAVRLPKDVAFGREMPVTIVRSGDVLTIYPARRPLKDMLRRLQKLPKPAAVEARDVEPLPERPGL